jgi:hypothetical protein
MKTLPEYRFFRIDTGGSGSRREHAECQSTPLPAAHSIPNAPGGCKPLLQHEIVNPRRGGRCCGNRPMLCRPALAYAAGGQ